MILVSGASGKTGRAILSGLVKRDQSVRAWVRREEQRESMFALGAADVFVGDISSREDWQKALQGTDRLYLICPNMSPDEDKIGKIAIEAAEEAGIQRFVYHSVLHPQVEDMAHHWLKLRVEEQLFKSSLVFTILQPAAYMQNVLGYWKTMMEDGVYRIPYSITSKSSMVDLNDVAEIATKALLDPGHEFAIYELCSRDAYSAADIAAIVQEKTGKSIKAEVVDRAEWEKNVRKAGLHDYAVRTLLKMFLYYEDYHFIGSGSVLSLLLGRDPVCFEEFVNRVLSSNNI